MAKLVWTHIVDTDDNERWSTTIEDQVAERTIVAVFHPLKQVQPPDSGGTFTAWIDWGMGKAPERPRKPLKDRAAAKRWCERRIKDFA